MARDSRGRFTSGGGGSGGSGGGGGGGRGSSVGGITGRNVGLRLTGDWKLMGDSLDEFESNFAKAIGIATERNAIHVRDEIRRRIDQKRYGRNAPRTLILKGGGHPLAGKTGAAEKAKGASGGGTGAALLKSLTQELLNPFEAIVGVNRWATWRGRKNIAKIVHDGITINVTDKMRRYFQFLAGKYADKGFKPLSAKTTKIVIPPRPFIKDVVEDKTVQLTLRKEWDRAVDAAFAGRAGA